MNQGAAGTTPTRRLTMADLALLVVAVAVALEILRPYLALYQSRIPATMLRGSMLGTLLDPFLLTLSAALMIARCRRPQPGWREAACQPGTFACLAILIEIAIKLPPSLWSRPFRVTFGPPPGIALLLAGSGFNGHFVAVGWATLALAGRWRAEPDWVDRSGRVVGVAALAVDLYAKVLP